MWLLAAMLIELASALGAYTQCYAEELGLTDTWKIEVAFDSLPQDWIAATSALPGYYIAYITYDTTALREVFDGFEESTDIDAVIRRVVLHELWHVMTWELGELAVAANPYGRRIEEQLATRIERLPLWQDIC